MTGSKQYNKLKNININVLTRFPAYINTHSYCIVRLWRYEVHDFVCSSF